MLDDNLIIKQVLDGFFVLTGGTQGSDDFSPVLHKKVPLDMFDISLISVNH